MSHRTVHSVQERRIDTLLICVATLLSLAILAKLRSILRFWSADVLDYARWYQHVLDHGRWRSLEASFASYNPPYIYLLSLISNFRSVLSPEMAIKAVLVPFLFASAGLFISICRAAGCSVRRSLIAGWIFLVAPEVVTNSLVLSQTDILETTFLLLMIRLLMAKRPGWAMASAGVALSFKLQAIFVGPAVLAMLLTGELPAWSLLTLAAGYAFMFLPAELAGRSSSAAAGVYNAQANSPAYISWGAANPYALLIHWTGFTSQGTLVTAIERIGLVVATIGTVLMVLLFLRRRPLLTRASKLLTVIAVSALAEPYLLPKMHDRYFYIGDTVVLVLAMIAPVNLLPAALLQVAAMAAYLPFMFGFHGTPKFYLLPVMMVTTAIWLLLRQLLKKSESAEATNAGADSITMNEGPAAG